MKTLQPVRMRTKVKLIFESEKPNVGLYHKKVFKVYRTFHASNPCPRECQYDRCTGIPSLYIYVRPCRETHPIPTSLKLDFTMPLNSLMVVLSLSPFPSLVRLDLDDFFFLGLRSFLE